MTDYLLDTNHASYLMANDPRIVAQLQERIMTGDRFGISVTILGELYFAVHASQRQEKNLHRLTQMVAILNMYPFDHLAAEEFGRIQAEQKKKGRPIPPLDAQIAAVARQLNLTILTADKHFEYVDTLTIENWLAT